MLKKKTVQPTSSKDQEWAQATKRVRPDRILLYLDKQDHLNPYQLKDTIKRYWAVGIALNLISLGLIAHAFFYTTSANINNQVKLVRVDGKFVEESHDERRRILVENIIKRVEIKEQQENTNKENP